ncbi:hypothetical protein EYF80_050837 [Liparis tanakae]|uniref:Uncharacterized protein n=1 Tax=Liparis tanakae TaxID=230148 RepID=A0A4Z2FCS3_9TELE|nr:hypothetical protein EYF80_050837 [Liparis tanakae]
MSQKRMKSEREHKNLKEDPDAAGTQEPNSTSFTSSTLSLSPVQDAELILQELNWTQRTLDGTGSLLRVEWGILDGSGLTWARLVRL